MKNKKMIIILALCLFVLFSCVEKQNEIADDETQTMNEVVFKFENDRDVLGTAKFIEDSFDEYPNNLTIATIYYYQSSMFYYEMYKDNETDIKEDVKQNLFDQVLASAKHIPDDYNGEFSEEIIKFKNEFMLLIDDEQLSKSDTTDQTFKSMTSSEKTKLKEFIEAKYEYFDEKDGTNTGDKYTDVIFDEACEKYGLSKRHVLEIWSSTEY